MKINKNIEHTCLEVLSKASASVTHEIKNILSIINENAGFLDDLNESPELEESGASPAQIQHVTDTIIKQVSRANTIMNNLNQFAHGLDSPVTGSNIEHSLSRLINLTARQAAMKNITVSLSCPSDCRIKTYLFFFESLIYLILSDFFHYSAEHSGLTIRVIENTSEITILFSPDKAGQHSYKEFFNKEKTLLLKQLSASLSDKKNSLELRLPADITADT